MALSTEILKHSISNTLLTWRLRTFCWLRRAKWNWVHFSSFHSSFSRFWCFSEDLLFFPFRWRGNRRNAAVHGPWGGKIAPLHPPIRHLVAGHYNDRIVWWRPALRGHEPHSNNVFHPSPRSPHRYPSTSCITNQLVKTPSQCSPEFLAFLGQCLIKDHTQRPLTDGLLKVFFEDLLTFSNRSCSRIMKVQDASPTLSIVQFKRRNCTNWYQINRRWRRTRRQR